MTITLINETNETLIIETDDGQKAELLPTGGYCPIVDGQIKISIKDKPFEDKNK